MSTGWIIFWAVVGIVLAAVLYAAWRIKRYLTRTQQHAQDNLSDIVEEIDSYQTKTQ